MTDLKTYSVIINWCDGDLEQGTYGWTGRAASEDDAEDKARRDMWMQERPDEPYPNDDDDALPGDKDPYGSVVDCVLGASWKAVDMEAVLRGLLSDDIARVAAARVAGASLLAEIDAVGRSTNEMLAFDETAG